EAALGELGAGALAARARNALRGFRELIEGLSRDSLLPLSSRERGEGADVLAATSVLGVVSSPESSSPAPLPEENGDEPLALARQIEHALARSALRDFYEKDSRGSAESRVENLDELVNVASRFRRTP